MLFLITFTLLYSSLNVEYVWRPLSLCSCGIYRHHECSTWCGEDGVLSISRIDGKERQADRQCGSSTRGKQSGPSEKHPQNNLYQNSFCQQILWRETPFRHNPLMHSRAHIQQHTRQSPPLTNKQYETPCSMLGLLVWSLCSLFIHGGKLLR